LSIVVGLAALALNSPEISLCLARGLVTPGADRLKPSDPEGLALAPMDSRYACSEPRISIIVPAHDATDTIEETLASALAQTERDLEVVVVDDDYACMDSSSFASILFDRASVRLPTCIRSHR